MITLPARSQIWLAAGITDMHKGMPGLAAFIVAPLAKDPLSGDVFVFRGRRGDQIKVLWFSGDGTNLCIKKLERGRLCGRAQVTVLHCLHHCSFLCCVRRSIGEHRLVPGGQPYRWLECIDIGLFADMP